MFQKIAYTCYPVQDMDRAVDFYKNTLRITLIFTGEEWSEFEIGGQRFALHKTPDRFSAATVATVSLEASPIELVVGKLIDQGVQMQQDIQFFSFGKLATFLDSEGNLLGLYEPPAKRSNR
ncbi:MAG: VOC family protein [Nitrospinota bacterium]|nr:VOC family protein [Nitrospinota bacterium]